MSSAEAEGYALGSGACEGLFICAVAKELGVELKLALHSESTATISQHAKMGLGRMKHVELRFLFVKDLLKRERLTLSKIPGTENPADLGTKVLDVNIHRTLVLDHWFEPAEQAVEEIRGNLRNLQSSGSVGLLNVWKGLRTLHSGHKRTQPSTHLHELRI